MAKRVLFVIAAILLLAPSVYAQTVRKVYTGGTSAGGDNTYTLTQLQNAIDDAAQNDACGSEILIEQNASVTSPSTGFVLRKLIVATPTWDCIKIRTGVDSSGNLLSASLFPASGNRMTTAYRSVLAEIKPSSNNEASMRTVYPGETGAGCTTAPCVASGWTLQWLEFSPKVNWAQRALVRFGTSKAGKEFQSGAWVDTLPAGQTQDTLVEIPRYLSFIQNDLHGDPVIGQHQGLLLSSADTRVLHNSFTDIKSLIETQAITGINGTGPWTIENNLIGGSTENFMIGGADTYLRGSATVTGTPTTTSIALASPVWVHLDGTTEAANLATDIYNNIFISITHAGTDYGGVTCAISGTTCTLSPALPFTPSVGDVVRWSWMTGGLTFRYNNVLKDPAWFNPILSTVSGVSPTASATGGSLAAGSYCYRVAARSFVSGSSTGDVSTYISSTPSTEQCATTTGTTGSVTITWTAHSAAASTATVYRVYGRTSGGQSMYWDVTAPTTTFTDTGSSGTPGTATFTGTIWPVKNNFELKHIDGAAPAGVALVEGNVFDYSWCCSQSNIISIKVNNQNTNDVSATIRNLTFRNNWIRHGNRALALTCTTTGNASPQSPSGPMTNVMISNNIWSDMSSAWVNTSGTLNNSALFITTGSYANEVPGKGCVDVSFVHNTFLYDTNDMNGPIQFNLNASTDKMTNFVLRDNIMARKCTTASCTSNATTSMKTFNPSNVGQGTTAWNAAVQGTSVADHNAWPDDASSMYTATAFPSDMFPTNATLQSDLTNYNNCKTGTDITGCALQATSTLHNAASDATDVGANVTNVKAFTDIAFSGIQGGGGVTPPTYVTAANGGGTAASITTASMTLSGANRYLVCAVATQNNSIGASTVTWNTSGGGSNALTKQQQNDFNNAGNMAHVEYWDLVNPPAATGSVTAAMGSSTATGLGCVQYQNVDQSTPHDAFAVAGGSSATVSVTVTSAAGDLVIDTTSVRVGTTGMTEGAGQTNRVERMSGSGVGNVTVLMSEEAGAASVNMTWTVDDATAKSWSTIGTSLNGVAAGAGSPTITSTSPLPTGVVGTAYNVTLTETGGTAPFTWTVVAGALPQGLTLSSGGTISGTPKTTGTSTFTVRVTDVSSATNDKVFTIKRLPPRPTSTTAGDEANIYNSTVEPSLDNDRIVRPGDFWNDQTTDVLKRRKLDDTWETIGAGGGGATTLATLTDVTIASPANNQFLRYSSGTSKWTNQTVSVFTQGGNAFGATATFGTTDAQPFSLIANSISRLTGNPTNNSVNLQAAGNNNPEIYVMSSDCTDWMNLGFNASDCRRIVQQAGGGTRRTYVGMAGHVAATDFVWSAGTSTNSGSTITRWIGVRADGLFSVKHLTLETGARPTCSSSERGTFWYVAGGAGVKDTVEVCAKDAADAYAWRVIY